MKGKQVVVPAIAHVRNEMRGPFADFERSLPGLRLVFGPKQLQISHAKGQADSTLEASKRVGEGPLGLMLPTRDRGEHDALVEQQPKVVVTTDGLVCLQDLQGLVKLL